MVKKTISQLRKEINVLKNKNRLLEDRRKIEEERRKLQRKRFELKYGKQKKILKKGMKAVGMASKGTYRFLQNLAESIEVEPRKQYRRKAKKKKR